MTNIDEHAFFLLDTPLGALARGAVAHDTRFRKPMLYPWSEDVRSKSRAHAARRARR
jgi:hypothetical protein